MLVRVLSKYFQQSEGSCTPRSETLGLEVNIRDHTGMASELLPDRDYLFTRERLQDHD